MAKKLAEAIQASQLGLVLCFLVRDKRGKFILNSSYSHVMLSRTFRIFLMQQGSCRQSHNDFVLLSVQLGTCKPCGIEESQTANRNK